jgi:hypothetical protein
MSPGGVHRRGWRGGRAGGIVGAVLHGAPPPGGRCSPEVHPG